VPTVCPPPLRSHASQPQQQHRGPLKNEGIRMKAGGWASTYPGILGEAVCPAKSRKQAVKQANSQGCPGAGVCSQKFGALSWLLAAHHWRRCGCLLSELAPCGVPGEL